MRGLKQGVVLALIVILLGIIAISIKFFQALNNAPIRMEHLQSAIGELSKKPTRFLTADGKLIYQVSSEFRIPIKLSEVPKNVQNAILAAEDKRFYSHEGVDLIGLARAATNAAKEGRATQGGSTLTMQLAKLMSDGSQRTFDRKLDDIALAFTMEREMTKDQILELYLNEVYFGEGAHGIAAAAKVYFNKSVKDLTLGEGAMLARCVRRPSSDNPVRNLDRAIENRNVVLGVMHTEGMISDAQLEAARAEKPHLNSNPQKTTAQRPNGAEYFVDSIERQLEDLKDQIPGFDPSAGGYTIETTLDSRLQRCAEDAVTSVVRENRANKVNTGAFVLIDRTGAILAEVGGSNYRHDNYNVITQGLMQPGSSFKPIVYAVAFKEGVIHSPEDRVSNAPIYKRDPSLPSGYWAPRNDSPKENAATYSVRQALSQSINLPAIHTIEAVGPDKVVLAAQQSFGFHSALEPVDPLGIGASSVNPLEMAQAYSVFMLRGDRVVPFAIKRIIGPDGAVVKDFTPVRIRNAFDPDICEMVDSMLQSVVRSGTGYDAHDIPDARGKTGTTNSHRDAWFCGYARGLLGVAWVGNEQKVKGIPTREPMGRHVYGGTVALHIWMKVIRLAEAIHPDTPVDPDALAQSSKDAEKAAASKFHQDQPGSVKVDDPDAATKPSDVGPSDDDDRSKEPDAGNPSQSLAPGVGDSGGSPPSATGVAPISPDPAEGASHRTSIVPPTPERGPRASRSNSASGAVAGDPAATAPSIPAEPSSSVRTTANLSAVSVRSKKRQSKYVSVDICADTGMKATIYCPETVTRRFLKGTEPRQYCTKHTANSGDGE